MASEQFLLKWNNFENNITSGFADLLQQEVMVDVTLAVEGRIVQAHKIILSICSSYFRNLFQINPCQHPIVVLKDVGYQELSDMLDFMYKGEANVKQEDLSSFLKLAETLKIKGLEGNQGESNNEKNKKYTESYLSDSSKNFKSNEKEIFSSEYFKQDQMLRKRKKRSVSPISLENSKILDDPQNVDSEIVKDDDYLENNNVNSGQNILIKEESLSDHSLDYYDNHAMQEMSEDKIARPSLADDSAEAISQVTWSANEYNVIEIGYQRHLLVTGGYLFRKRSTTPSKSYWVCCKMKCSAKGILRPDGEFQLTDFRHNHEPDHENVKKKGQLLELKKLALKVDSSGRDLLKITGIKENISKHLSFIRTVRHRKKKQQKRFSTVRETRS